jgi:hypothetical protein
MKKQQHNFVNAMNFIFYSLSLPLLYHPWCWRLLSSILNSSCDSGSFFMRFLRLLASVYLAQRVFQQRLSEFPKVDTPAVLPLLNMHAQHC